MLDVNMHMTPQRQSRKRAHSDFVAIFVGAAFMTLPVSADEGEPKADTWVSPKDQERIMTKEQSKPAPLETGPGEQKDDNIDDLGRKQDGSKQDQPGTTKPTKP